MNAESGTPIDLRTDPLTQAIFNGIFRDIRIALENRCYAAAVILLFAGIDAMANLGRDKDKEYSSPADFKAWVDRYFCFPDDPARITPEEWWAARNAVIHTYGEYSRSHRCKGVRLLGWCEGGDYSVVYVPSVDPGKILVKISAMKDSFVKGTEHFLADWLTDPRKRPVLEARMERLVMQFKREPSAQSDGTA